MQKKLSEIVQLIKQSVAQNYDKNLVAYLFLTEQDRINISTVILDSNLHETIKKTIRKMSAYCQHYICGRQPDL